MPSRTRGASSTSITRSAATRQVCGESPSHRSEMPTLVRAGAHLLTAVLAAGHAVDRLTDQVGVTVVPGVLLDHVDVEHPQRHVLAVAVERHVEVEGLGRFVGLTLLVEELGHGTLGIRRVD